MYSTNELITGDGLRLFTHDWSPGPAPRAAIQLVHGLGEHGGRYEHVGAFLGDRGYALAAADLRGHGRSEGLRGHAPGYESLMDDISRMIEATRERYPDTPVFLYGHSMGGNLVINHALRRRPALAGVIASAPLLRVVTEPPLWKRMLGNAMIRIRPSVSVSNGIRNEDLSRDPKVVRDYEDDPLVHDRVTVRFLEIRRAGRWALEHAAEFPLPLLLMHGMGDRITSHRASAAFDAAAGDPCTLKIWDNLFHEIHNEPEREEVLSFVAQWLSAVLEGRIRMPDRESPGLNSHNKL